MHSRKYIENKRKRNSDRGKYGNEVKRQMMIDRGSEMRVVATVRTSGSLGDHLIELLDCGEPMLVWVRMDDRIYRSRTARGFVSLLGRRMWKTKG